MGLLQTWIMLDKLYGVILGFYFSCLFNILEKVSFYFSCLEERCNAVKLQKCSVDYKTRK